MATLSQRLAALEQRVMMVRQNVFRIICKGATPDAVEQSQIDAADARGDFVICRLIVSPPVQRVSRESHGNA